MARARMARALALSVVSSLLVLTPASSPAEPSAATTHPSVTPASLQAAAEHSGLTLTRVSPVVAGPGEPVTITGLLDVAALGLDLSAGAPATPAPSDPTEPPTSAPASPEAMATVETRLGADGLESHDDVSDWLSTMGASQGRVLASTDVLIASDTTVDPIPFSMTIGDLRERMREAYGVLPVSVEVRLPGATEPAAVLRTFVGYQLRKEYEPLQLAWVVPITVPHDPALLGEFGEDRTAAWQALVGDGGRLRERLASASGPTVVWAVDPALLGAGPAPEPTEQDQADGPAATPTDTPPAAAGSPTPSTTSPTAPTVGTSPGSATGGTTTTDAPPTTSTTGVTPEGIPQDADDDPALVERRLRTEFADLLLEASGGRTVLLLPAHDADVAALPAPTSEGRTPAAIRSLIRRSLDVGTATTQLVGAGATVAPTAWPAAGGWSSTLDAALSGLSDETEEPWSVLSSTSSLGNTTSGPFPSATGATVLPYDALLSERASAAQDRGGALTSALAVVADSLVMLNERPGTTRHVIVALERDGAAADLSSDLTSVLAEVPWLELTGVAAPTHDASLVDQPPSAAVPTVITDARARDLAVTIERLPIAASVRADTGAELASRGADTLAQLTSVRWRGHQEDWTTAYAPIGAEVAETFTGLTIPSRDISFLADSGLMRVTVENSLDTGIQNATLDLTVEHPILRIESGPQQVEVGADSRSTVGFQATAIASGRVSVTATLRAPDGTVLGEPTQFSVRVSPTSDWIYWVLGGLAGLVIAIGLARMALSRRPSA